MTPAEQAALAALEKALQQFGVPEHKAPAMAAQLDKRAHQLAAESDRTHEQALIHLLQLMKNAHDERTK